MQLRLKKISATVELLTQPWITGNEIPATVCTDGIPIDAEFMWAEVEGKIISFIFSHPSFPMVELNVPEMQKPQIEIFSAKTEVAEPAGGFVVTGEYLQKALPNYFGEDEAAEIAGWLNDYIPVAQQAGFIPESGVFLLVRTDSIDSAHVVFEFMANGQYVWTIPFPRLEQWHMERKQPGDSDETN